MPETVNIIEALLVSEHPARLKIEREWRPPLGLSLSLVPTQEASSGMRGIPSKLLPLVQRVKRDNCDNRYKPDWKDTGLLQTAEKLGKL